MRVMGFGLLALGSALLCGNVGLANEIVTDANIVTGLDISYSIEPDDMRLEIERHGPRDPLARGPRRNSRRAIRAHRVCGVRVAS